MTTNPIVRLENVGKQYGKVVSLKNESLEIGSNEIVGLIGDNGAALMMIDDKLGLRPPPAPAPAAQV